MIHCRHVAQVSQHHVTHVSTADLERGQEVQSGSVHYQHLEGERELLYTVDGMKAEGIQLCFN